MEEKNKPEFSFTEPTSNAPARTFEELMAIANAAKGAPPEPVVVQRPTVGRVVHFIDDDGVHLAATIAAVHSDTCITIGYLTRFGEPAAARSVCFGFGRHQWCWPTRV